MAQIDLVCYACKHAYRVETESLLKDEEKNCPECGSDSVRQIFSSYMRNGALIDPKWARLGGSCSHFG